MLNSSSDTEYKFFGCIMKEEHYLEIKNFIFNVLKFPKKARNAEGKTFIFDGQYKFAGYIIKRKHNFDLESKVL